MALNEVSAPPIGRGLRIALGLVLLAVSVDLYRKGSARFVVLSAAVAVVVLLFYLAVHRAVARRGDGVPAWLGLAAIIAPVALVYVLGFGGGPVFGSGEGQLGALTFLGLSLVLAGVRGDPGCEVMAFPNALARRDASLPCLVFSPIDKMSGRPDERT